MLRREWSGSAAAAAASADEQLALLLALSTSGVAESLGEGIVIDLELRDFLVLIGGNGDEFSLRGKSEGKKEMLG